MFIITSAGWLVLRPSCIHSALHKHMIKNPSELTPILAETIMAPATPRMAAALAMLSRGIC